MIESIGTEKATVSFTAMADATPEEWTAVLSAEVPRVRPLAEDVLLQLQEIGGDPGALAVDRLTHCLQTATRAEREGRSDLYVLAALVHDVGDTLAPRNHSALAAAMLQPYLPEELHWMVLHHGEFQFYYYGQYVGVDPDLREQYRGHACFDLTEEFCAEFDQNSFDPSYLTEPLEHFAPLVRQYMCQ